MAGRYKKLDEEELIAFVLQYEYADDQLEEALEKRHQVQEVMDEALGWSEMDIVMVETLVADN